MTTQKIAEALCESSLEICEKSIIPPWIEDEESSPLNDGCQRVRNAWQQVRTLRSQREQLTEIWPHKCAILQEQFNDAVMQLARDLYTQLFEVAA